MTEALKEDTHVSEIAVPESKKKISLSLKLLRQKKDNNDNFHVFDWLLLLNVSFSSSLVYSLVLLQRNIFFSVSKRNTRDGNNGIPSMEREQGLSQGGNWRGKECNMHSYPNF